MRHLTFNISWDDRYSCGDPHEKSLQFFGVVVENTRMDIDVNVRFENSTCYEVV
jgi:hypothetical protein